MSERRVTICDGCENPVIERERCALLVDVHGTGEELERVDFCLHCAQNVTVIDVAAIAHCNRGSQLPEDSRKRIEELRKRLKAYKR